MMTTTTKHAADLTAGDKVKLWLPGHGTRKAGEHIVEVQKVEDDHRLRKVTFVGVEKPRWYSPAWPLELVAMEVVE